VPSFIKDLEEEVNPPGIIDEPSSSQLNVDNLDEVQSEEGDDQPELPVADQPLVDGSDQKEMPVGGDIDQRFSFLDDIDDDELEHPDQVEE